MKTLPIATLALAFIALGVALFYHPAVPMAPQPAQVGAAASPDVYQHTFFHDNATIGGYDFATTSQGSVTYTAASFVNAKVIEHIASGATTATLPTNALMSAAGFLPNVGDNETKFIHASTTKVTLAGSTGVTLSSASSTFAISPNSTGALHCTRLGALEGRLIQCMLVAD